VGVATASLPVIVDFQPRGEPIAEYLSKFVSDWRSSPTQNIPEQVERDGKSDIADFVLGPDDAPVQIVEFADFECGACQAVYPQIEALLKEYRGVIRYSLRHFPLDISCNKRINRPMHLHACQLAELAQCAGAQSKFWEVVPILYKIGAQIGSDQSLLDPPLMGEFPGINLDREEFKRCIDSGSQRGVIAGDIDVADSLGLSGTPSFWINGRRVQRPNVEGIRAIIRSVVEEGKSRDR
jgi:protein-disulfide isomerase